MRFAAVIVALLISTVVAFAGDPVGSYSVEGTNPGNGSHYKGTVVVERTGKTYRVVWNVAGARYVGTGIGNEDFIAVSYKSGNDSGLALYGAKGEDWAGVWTYSSGRDVGTEIWSRD